MCRPSDSNTSIDIYFSVHDAFLEQPSTGTLITTRLENQIFRDLIYVHFKLFMFGLECEIISFLSILCVVIV
jgi:hypothetical protein